MDEELSSDKKKPHRERLSGRKADKKKTKKDHVQELSAKQRNPKAFAISSAISAERRFRRTQDLKRKKEHIPVVDRRPLEPPPILVAVVGPPKVGKSQLIKSLIKSYTRQPLTAIKGPVTVISGKKQRITFIECNNDINCMVDIAKVADLVLLLIDASFGFEMEIFEFLNICQVHGMPKVMGVLTHLDMIKQTKKMQKTKKILKHRFWKEVYPGAKLFYLSKVLHGSYLKNEIKNLARFISVMKFRPLVWQTSHPYMLADRMEDTTPPEQIQLNSKVDRNVCFYGYMRGIPMNKNCFIHIAGSGDYAMSDINFLPDPCPLPEQLKKRSLIEKERFVYAPFSGVGGIVYDKDAVYVELPGGQNQNEEISSNNPANGLVSLLRDTKETVDTKLASSRVQLFSGGEAIIASEFDKSNTSKNNEDESQQYEVIEGSDGRKRRKVVFPEETGELSEDNSDIEIEGNEDCEYENGEKISSGETDLESSEDENNTEGSKNKIRTKGLSNKQDNVIRDKINKAIASIEKNKKTNDKDDWSDLSSSDEENDANDITESKFPWEADKSGSSDAEDSGVEDTDLNWKNNLVEKAARAFEERQLSKANLFKLVYHDNVGQNKTEEDDDNSNTKIIGELFKVVKKDQENTVKNKDLINGLDCSKFPVVQIRDWNNEEVVDSIKDCFVTGKWKDEEDANELLKLDDMSEEDEELFGDFEDLETGEKFEADKATCKTEKKELSQEELMEKKKKLKAKFDEEYDTKGDNEDSYFEELKMETNRQAELNKKHFEGIDDAVRVQIEGYRAGMYVRIEVKQMPCEVVENFDPTYPIVIGGLQPGEQNIGYVKGRVKKHRWYSKILKTRDPLIISMGWRRFQTISIYSKQEDNLRHRAIKYTPEHVGCMMHFWGPTTRAGTGFLALLSSENAKVDPGFRIVATGTIVDTDQSTIVTKKLKLTGNPMKIYKKTAFISGMFNSVLEVARFEGAKIKTVSGIRGQIKKPLNKPEGAFRATFEDKIRLSDIVFCRTWYQLDVPKFYTPVTSLLLPPAEKNTWKGMRTLGALKREKGIRNLPQTDSMYKEIIRSEKVSHPLVIPRALEKELPFKYKSKVKQEMVKSNVPFMAKVKKVVVKDDHEARVASLLRKLEVNYKTKVEKVKAENKAKRRELRKKKEIEQMRQMKKHKEIKKSVYRALSKMEKKKEQSRN